MNQKLPPMTIPSKSIIKQTRNPLLDIKIAVEVIGDTTSNKIVGGETKFDPIGDIPDGKGGRYTYRTPDYMLHNQHIINKFTSAMEIKFTVKIQTSYGPKSNASHKSAYGRGTTPTDEKTGNTSLGFHEACHRNDCINYLKNTALPVFGCRVGMTEQQYIQSTNLFGKALDKYFTDMAKDSEKHTDEVGYKKSTFKIKRPGP